MAEIAVEMLEESEIFGGDGENSETADRKKYLVVRLVMKRKFGIALQEMVLRRMKSGQDVDRNQLIGEAISLLIQKENEGKRA